MGKNQKIAYQMTLIDNQKLNLNYEKRQKNIYQTRPI